jgi:hypothetical protein
MAAAFPSKPHPPDVIGWLAPAADSISNRCRLFARDGRASSGVRGASISENAYFRAPHGTCALYPVINLQHTNSFDMENPQSHKNAAIGDGFCLLVFLKMALVLMRRTSAMPMGT